MWNIAIEKGINVLDYAAKTKNCGLIENGGESGWIVLNVDKFVCESNEIYPSQGRSKKVLCNTILVMYHVHHKQLMEFQLLTNF